MSMQISVMIPNFNHGHLLESCIKLYANQQFIPAEVIVVDDGYF